MKHLVCLTAVSLAFASCGDTTDKRIDQANDSLNHLSGNLENQKAVYEVISEMKSVRDLTWLNYQRYATTFTEDDNRAFQASYNDEHYKMSLKVDLLASWALSSLRDNISLRPNSFKDLAAGIDKDISLLINLLRDEATENLDTIEMVEASLDDVINGKIDSITNENVNDRWRDKNRALKYMIQDLKALQKMAASKGTIECLVFEESCES